MEYIPFTVSARTARLIGHQNFANPEGAIIELVKNGYDADGSISITYFDRVQKKLFIIDNGIGMTKEVITDHWMTIGTDNKYNDAFTKSGRIKAGAKGIGRFALDRLGHSCRMITKSIEEKILYKWSVKWDEFENNSKIHEVFASLESSKKDDFINHVKNISNINLFQQIIKKHDFKSGTILEISDLKDEWQEITLEALFENLEIVTPPDGSGKFQMYLIDKESISKYGLVNQIGFNDYDYKVIATYNKNSQREIKITIHRNEFDSTIIDKNVFKREDMKNFPFDRNTFEREKFEIKKTFYNLIPGLKESERNNISESIGDFKFVFYYMKNSMSSDDRDKNFYKEFLGTRSGWIKKWGGIKIYRDNFRVRPYGELNTPSYDWLLLGERQAQNPAAPSRKYSWRVRPNQVAGVVNISRIANANFDDTSNRAGLQENESFELFKNLLIGLIKVFEDDKSTINHNLNELYNEKNRDKVEEQQADKFAEDDNENFDSEEIKKRNKVLKHGIRTKNRIIAEKDLELSLMRAMASAGVLVASFSHEFESIKNKLNSRTFYLKRNIVPYISEKEAGKLAINKNPYFNILEIQRIDKKIQQWINFSIELTRKDRRTGQHINIINYFDNFKNIWSNLLDERKIEFKLVYNKKEREEFKLKIIELDLDTIFDNLLTNSVEAFQRNGFNGKRIICVTIVIQGNFLKINYVDSGPGLSKEISDPNKIFIPMFSTKVDSNGKEIGTGLGMWLTKAAIDYNKGKVEVLKPISGFAINIYLKKLK